MDEDTPQTRVLLIEDNADDEQLTLRSLRKCIHPPEVDVVRDGAQAAEYIERIREGQSCPDLALLDLKLPKMNGLEVLKRIRANEATQSLPVVVLTSSDETSDVDSCYAAGANSYVCKPVDYHDFVQTVRSIADFWLEVSRLPSGTPAPDILGMR